MAGNPSVSAKIGILGGGQLGRMLLQKAADWNLITHVLDPDPNAPCKDIASSFTIGHFNDEAAVYEFGKELEVLTIEIEHVNTTALERLEQEGRKIFPQPRVIRLIQDKGAQKSFFREHGIPTAPFTLVNNKSEILSGGTELPVMQKLRRGGYDGKGVQPLRSTADLDMAFDAPSVLEAWVPFEREVAVIVARNSRGHCKAFPPVEMDFNKEANLVEFLFSPSSLSPAVAAEAERIARQVAEALDMVGVLAVEMFLTTTGELLVNELAPRPHNSGHHTIEANQTSQYEQHLRAILGLPLGDTSIIQPAVMVNLLGEKGFEGPARYEGLEEALSIPGVHVHLYGKLLTKPFRKMGHVTVCHPDLEEARRIARTIRDTLKVKA
ncbi:MAG: 5-(carboxyamino)imidazole ribonucleotide synthase [Bacteroidia bacterium]|nr:5-(carboxyamino)imidazole ribonucleotide synthase [Bacteroidia bacterium]MBP7269060.1 5-(carboxyamino)imidazole ribonucleotide synthase [Bacteroidia bacterium]MBP7436343.1 5-(carboxyamino)imidazole ribonucleotide synthase [Bacteroidia bacterium]MBP7772239.1 5-(carboxyamino)imidazole ribonucleotide synthase [Bacteroidia bacterium]